MPPEAVLEAVGEAVESIWGAVQGHFPGEVAREGWICARRGQRSAWGVASLKCPWDRG